MSTATFVDIIIAILLPPLGVFLRFGCGVFIFPLIFRLSFILVN
ncbi:RCI2A [Arabidopsis thaliana]|uniref:RCI2A n=1 Tax=Arabidopsis thaliana TaxID=3702 RepID=A0A178V8P1_ARATH|nr:RCI2A [Arabidopsis thaliana]